ncbi:hypothetical protein F5148DRAFT_1147141 [Russula earlei]|uniref:Uncharacterized protein n=1 Tax=Russula earlei TaxID=71964 RepID=A0ACC0UJ38_9AGAM|nr:hypothetical protein F5148DRAFT_1147141 [Russula earlei]
MGMELQFKMLPELLDVPRRTFVRKLTPAEKEEEKKWVDEHLGFKGAWTKSEHVKACWWITIAIILHNMVIEFGESGSAAQLLPIHGQDQEEEETGMTQEGLGAVQMEGEAKRHLLINQLMEYQRLQ